VLPGLALYAFKRARPNSEQAYPFSNVIACFRSTPCVRCWRNQNCCVLQAKIH